MTPDRLAITLLHPPESDLMTAVPAGSSTVPWSAYANISRTWAPETDPLLGMLPKTKSDPDLNGLPDALLSHRSEDVLGAVAASAVPKQAKQEPLLKLGAVKPARRAFPSPKR